MGDEVDPDDADRPVQAWERPEPPASGAGIERLSLDELKLIVAKLGAAVDAHFKELGK
ncbi:hypothetical protein [Streptomyces bohaiensis]|uniref:hypothetical protein n=1 Tax=Streptomyces bohaiensis TaxID=1431344 RepID=UPI003B7DFBD0